MQSYTVPRSRNLFEDIFIFLFQFISRVTHKQKKQNVFVDMCLIQGIPEV